MHQKAPLFSRLNFQGDIPPPIWALRPAEGAHFLADNFLSENLPIFHVGRQLLESISHTACNDAGGTLGYHHTCRISDHHQVSGRYDVDLNQRKT